MYSMTSCTDFSPDTREGQLIRVVEAGTAGCPPAPPNTKVGRESQDPPALGPVLGGDHRISTRPLARELTWLPPILTSEKYLRTARRQPGLTHLGVREVQPPPRTERRRS